MQTAVKTHQLPKTAPPGRLMLRDAFSYHCPIFSRFWLFYDNLRDLGCFQRLYYFLGLLQLTLSGLKLGLEKTHLAR